MQTKVYLSKLNGLENVEIVAEDKDSMEVLKAAIDFWVKELKE